MKTNYIVLILSKYCSITGDTRATFENSVDAETYMNLLLTKLHSRETKAFYREAMKFLQVEFVVASEQSNTKSAPSLVAAVPLLQLDLESIEDVLDGMIIEFLDDLLQGEKNLLRKLVQEDSVTPISTLTTYWGTKATA